MKLLLLFVLGLGPAMAQTQYNFAIVTNQGQFVNANINRGNCGVDFTSSPPAFKCAMTKPTSIILGGLFAKRCTLPMIMMGVDTNGNPICEALPTSQSPTSRLVAYKLVRNSDGSYSLPQSVVIDSTPDPVTGAQSASLDPPFLLFRNGLLQAFSEDFLVDTSDPRRVVPLSYPDRIALVNDACKSNNNEPNDTRPPCWSNEDLILAVI